MVPFKADRPWCRTSPQSPTNGETKWVCCVTQGLVPSLTGEGDPAPAQTDPGAGGNIVLKRARYPWKCPDKEGWRSSRLTWTHANVDARVVRGDCCQHVSQCPACFHHTMMGWKTEGTCLECPSITSLNTVHLPVWRSQQQELRSRLCLMTVAVTGIKEASFLRWEQVVFTLIAC